RGQAGPAETRPSARPAPTLPARQASRPPRLAAPVISRPPSRPALLAAHGPGGHGTHARPGGTRADGPQIQCRRGPSVAVRETADGAHRPPWRPGQRPLYVRGHRNTPTRSDTP